MSRADQGCCCDNVKTPDEANCCLLYEHTTPSGVTTLGCADSYNITWQNIQLWDAVMGVTGGVCNYVFGDLVGTPHLQNWGWEITANNVTVIKQVGLGHAGGHYLPANQVQGTAAARCNGLTTKVRGNAITGKSSCYASNYNNTCLDRPATCQRYGSGTSCPGRGFFFCGLNYDVMQVNFGFVELTCINTSPTTYCSDGVKMFQVEISFWNNTELITTLNSADATDTNCGSTGAFPCMEHVQYGSSADPCHHTVSPPVCGSLCGARRKLLFRTGTLPANACPNGQVYSLYDWEPSFQWASGSVTVA